MYDTIVFRYGIHLTNCILLSPDKTTVLVPFFSLVLSNDFRGMYEWRYELGYEFLAGGQFVPKKDLTDRKLFLRGRQGRYVNFKYY